MRRSFGGNRGMGGGGGGGGGILRTVQRTVRTGVGGATQEPFSHSSTTTTTATAAAAATGNGSNATKRTYKPTTTSNILSRSSTSHFSSSNLPISVNSSGPTWASSCSSPICSDELDWVCVDGFEDERANGFCGDFVFGSVPSKDEVQQAVSSLQQVLDQASFSRFVKDRFTYTSNEDVSYQDTSPNGLMHRVSSTESELDWIEPSVHLCNPIMLQPYGSGRVYDAFHLLQTEPSVQKMVISLSSDKAVWDAVLNNEVVRELRESFNTAEKNVPESSDNSSNDPNAAVNILSWIFDNTKAKVMGVIDKITKLVNEFFQAPHDDEKTTGGTKDPLKEKLRTSFMLSVVVMLIVVVTRARRA